jgi:hypothetical protein
MALITLIGLLHFSSDVHIYFPGDYNRNNVGKAERLQCFDEVPEAQDASAVLLDE